MSVSLSLLGVPSSAGARAPGQELAPRWIREAGLCDDLRRAGMEVRDFGDLPSLAYSHDSLNPTQQNLPLVIGAMSQVAQAVEAAATNESALIVLGGDCTVTIGVVAGLLSHRPNLGLVYFDGDADLNTPETSLSGILDGMALAHILGEGNDQLCRLGRRNPMLEERNVVLFGYSVSAGGIDPPELARLKNSAISRFPLELVKENITRSAGQAISILDSRVEHYLVHFDVDVLDGRDFPAADVPHQPGLTLEEARQALCVFMRSPKVVGLVLTEFNVRNDSRQELARRLVAVLVDVLRHRP